jgi:hypothetical protein
MVIQRYPHTATISYHTPGTYNTVGAYAEGTLVTISISCNIQPNNSRYIITESGDMIGYSYFITAPFFSDVDNVPKDAKLEFFDKEHVLLHLFPYQNHVEMKV